MVGNWRDCMPTSVILQESASGISARDRSFAPTWLHLTVTPFFMNRHGNSPCRSATELPLPLNQEWIRFAISAQPTLLLEAREHHWFPSAISCCLADISFA